MNFIEDTEIKVHMGYDARNPDEKKKAEFIAKKMIPHIKAQRKELEKLFDKFMEMSLEELKEVFK